MIRIATSVVGVATVVFLILTWGPLSASTASLVPAWQAVAATTVFGIPIVLAAASPWFSIRLLRRSLGGYSILFSLVVVTFVPAMTSPALPDGVAPWPVLITAIGTAPAALAWRPIPAWIFVVANSLAIAPVRYWAAGGTDLSTSLQYAFFTVTFAGMFTGILLIALSNGRALDAATTAARTAAASAAAAIAREQEQARLDALVHDEVISTLFAAAENRPEHAPILRRQAQATLNHLARLRNPATADAPPVGAAEFVQQITSVVSSVCSSVGIDVRGARTTPVPGLVAETFAEATAEAVRNSYDHADGDKPATRRTTLVLDEQRIQVSVVDDGVGFDPRAVPPHRLGIAVSIIGRLAALDGGRATVNSRPGGGTEVVLEWSAP